LAETLLNFEYRRGNNRSYKNIYKNRGKGRVLPLPLLNQRL